MVRNLLLKIMESERSEVNKTKQLSIFYFWVLRGGK